MGGMGERPRCDGGSPAAIRFGPVLAWPATIVTWEKHIGRHSRQIWREFRCFGGVADGLRVESVIGRQTLRPVSPSDRPRSQTTSVTTSRKPRHRTTSRKYRATTPLRSRHLTQPANAAAPWRVASRGGQTDATTNSTTNDLQRHDPMRCRRSRAEEGTYFLGGPTVLHTGTIEPRSAVCTTAPIRPHTRSAMACRCRLTMPTMRIEDYVAGRDIAGEGDENRRRRSTSFRREGRRPCRPGSTRGTLAPASRCRRDCRRRSLTASRGRNARTRNGD